MSFITILRLNTITLSTLLLSSCGGSGTKGTTPDNSTDQGDKKVFLIGDSTMHIHSSEYLLNAVKIDCGDDNPENIYAGWGDEFGFYAKKPENIFNRARAGSSSVSYREHDGGDHDKFGVDRIWSHTLELMETEGAGFLLIQFGSANENDHAPGEIDYDNDGDIDQDDEALRRELRKNNFDEAIGNYIKEARNKNIVPILISPPDGRTKGAAAAGTHPHTRGVFPQYILQLGIDHGVAVLDLNTKSNEEFAKLTDEELLRDFGDCAKNEGRGTIDRTHYEPHGARTVAGWVKELTCSANDSNEDKKLLCEQFKSSESEQPNNSAKDTIYEDAENGNTNGFFVRGNGRVDDISVLLPDAEKK